MYDQEKTVVLTGVVKQFVGQANHAELHFYLLAPDRKGIAKTSDGKYIEWGVEMAGAAAVAQQGITAASFGVGTVFSVKLNPLRDGSNFGSRTGAIAKCPIDPATNKAKLPAADKTLRFRPRQHTERRNDLLVRKREAPLLVASLLQRLPLFPPTDVDSD